MTATSTSTASSTLDSSSGFSSDQQEKALRNVQDRLSVAKRVLKAVKRDSSNDNCSANEIRRLKLNLRAALSRVEKPEQWNDLDSSLRRVSFDIPCVSSSTDNELSPSEWKVRHGKFSWMTPFNSYFRQPPNHSLAADYVLSIPRQYQEEPRTDQLIRRDNDVSNRCKSQDAFPISSPCTSTSNW